MYAAHLSHPVPDAFLPLTVASGIYSPPEHICASGTSSPRNPKPWSVVRAPFRNLTPEVLILKP